MATLKLIAVDEHQEDVLAYMTHKYLTTHQVNENDELQTADLLAVKGLYDSLSPVLKEVYPLSEVL